MPCINQALFARVKVAYMRAIKNISFHKIIIIIMLY